MDADLGDLKSFNKSSSDLFKLASHSGSNNIKAYKKIYFINNAGSIGPQEFVGTKTGPEYMNQFSETFDFNVISSCTLTSELMSIYRASRLAGSHLTIINVSSLAALVPYDSWSIYCAGKAAREMFHRVVASENAKDTCLSIMNYAPGPLDTDMSKEIRESATLHSEAREYFQSLKEKNEVVQVAESAGKLVTLLLTSNYTNGSHVDFYDDMDQTKATLGNNTKPAAGNRKCDSCGCGASCGPQCQCPIAKAKASVNKAAVEGECDSCGCGASCGGPQCQCPIAKAKASVNKAAVDGECDSCGCGASCGPQCQCPIAKAKASAGKA